MFFESQACVKMKLMLWQKLNEICIESLFDQLSTFFKPTNLSKNKMFFEIFVNLLQKKFYLYEKFFFNNFSVEALKAKLHQACQEETIKNFDA